MTEALRAIPILPELGAFVAFALIFFLFRAREMAELNATLTRITEANNAQNRAISDANNAQIRGMSEEFQSVIREQNRNAAASQRNYQQQLQVLTDSHIKVSRESIAMLGEIKVGLGEIEGAFRAHTVELEGVKQDVRDLKERHTLPPAPPPPPALPFGSG